MVLESMVAAFLLMTEDLRLKTGDGRCRLGYPQAFDRTGYGFTASPLFGCISKCTWVEPPAALPVLPTYPMMSPADTWPEAPNRSRWLAM